MGLTINLSHTYTSTGTTMLGNSPFHNYHKVSWGGDPEVNHWRCHQCWGVFNIIDEQPIVEIDYIDVTTLSASSHSFLPMKRLFCSACG